MMTEEKKSFYNALESLVSVDENKRGISHLFIENELYKASKQLLKANNIVIATGFPCNTFDGYPATESDGPPGVIMLAYCLLKQHSKRNITVVFDDAHAVVMERLVELLNENLLKHGIKGKINTFNAKDISKPSEFFDIYTNIDHMVAIELGGPNKDNKFKTMMDRDISDKCGLTPFLFDYAFAHQICTTTGIGDGGNEVGMSNVYDNVIQYINLGHKIACKVKCNNLITAGVSNWGAEALGLAVLKETDVAIDAVKMMRLHKDIYIKCGEYGAADGIKKVATFGGSVDGLPFEYHQNVWKKMLNVIGVKIPSKM